jgi:Tol biopolymer transport system component
MVMGRLKIIISILFLATAGLITLECSRVDEGTSEIDIIHPFKDALFPPEFPAPRFEWWSKVPGRTTYEVSLYTKDKEQLIQATTGERNWSPDEADWDNLKIHSDFKKIYFEVQRKGENNPARVSFRLSRDSVNAPVLYRQMPIPFLIAEKQLDSMSYMLIDFGSKKKPHTTMKGFSVCGNCHSFTADGGMMGTDLDAGLRDKGGYFVAPIEDTMSFNLSNYTSWSKLENRRTFGLFSKLSPDGRYIVTTVKDRVVIKNFSFPPPENLAYSQLFFAVNGHLAIYDRQTGTLKELPGANDPEYVHTNAIWTPDGKNIIFSRAKALPREGKIYEIDVKDEQLVNAYVDRKKTLKYDLYTIPFNDGNGGEAKPLEGASNNGKSNYFPAISPDGKWIIYCQAENFMLLQPDSRLFIIPASGGKARKLACNFNSMNSWHAWSPNSKWMVFVSKIFGANTDMFLTHIDKKGRASIPILVDRARKPMRVVNYPEFVNRKPGETFVMNYDFVELVHIQRAIKKGDFEKARELFYTLEKQKTFYFKEDYEDLSLLLEKMGMLEESEKYAKLAESIDNTTVFQN